MTRVISGRCVPPRKGSLSMTTSPGSSGECVEPHCSMAAATDMGMEPRCTGMWSPMAMTWPRGIEDGAGIVAALFDVGRERGAAQGGAHLFGDGVVEVLEDFEFDWIAHARDECTSNGHRWDYTELLPPLIQNWSRRSRMRSLAVFAAAANPRIGLRGQGRIPNHRIR